MVKSGATRAAASDLGYHKLMKTIPAAHRYLLKRSFRNTLGKGVPACRKFYNCVWWLRKRYQPKEVSEALKEQMARNEERREEQQATETESEHSSKSKFWNQNQHLKKPHRKVEGHENSQQRGNKLQYGKRVCCRNLLHLSAQLLLLR